MMRNGWEIQRCILRSSAPKLRRTSKKLEEDSVVARLRSPTYEAFQSGFHYFNGEWRRQFPLCLQYCILHLITFHENPSIFRCNFHYRWSIITTTKAFLKKFRKLRFFCIVIHSNLGIRGQSQVKFKNVFMWTLWLLNLSLDLCTKENLYALFLKDLSFIIYPKKITL